ncbi:PqiC family protein [soil metagenome]
MSRWLLLVGLLAACRSASPHYYTLVASPADSVPTTSELQLDVLPIDVPSDVDRSEIVVRTGTGEVTPVDTRSWIAPLSREIRRAFADDLSHQLGARDIAGLTPAAGVPTFRVKLAVKRFDSLLGQRAVIEAISTVHDTASDAPTLVCSHRASEAAGAGYAGIAEAHQRALAAIAKQVAESIRSIRAGAPACAGL